MNGKNKKTKQLVIIGAGGYAKSVLDSLRDNEDYSILGFIDEQTDKDEHLGYPVLAHTMREIPNPSQYVYFIAIGSNIKRKGWFDIIKAMGLSLINVIDSTAIVSSKSSLGEGVFVGKLAIVNADVLVGDNVVINTMSLLEHGCRVGSHSNVSTKAVLNGDVVIGEGVFVGSCSVIIGQLTVGSWTIVGAGAVVIRSVNSNTTVAGVPAKVIRNEARFW